MFFYIICFIISTKNSFNYLFLKRFAYLLHVFLPLSRLPLNVHHDNERIYSHALILVLLILISEIALQFVIYFVGLLSSEYLVQLGKSSGERDFVAFRWLVIRSFAYLTLKALLKSFSPLLSSLLYQIQHNKIKIKEKMIMQEYIKIIQYKRKKYIEKLN